MIVKLFYGFLFLVLFNSYCFVFVFFQGECFSFALSFYVLIDCWLTSSGNISTLFKLLKSSTETVSSRWFRWFSTVTPASSTTKTGRHDIAEILQIFLPKALKHNHSNDACQSGHNSSNISYIRQYCVVDLINVVLGNDQQTRKKIIFRNTSITPRKWP
jgi:hypothetical protein